MKSNTKKLVLSALFLALGYILPFFTGQIPEIGQMLLPMHIPVLICGFVCSWQWGLAVGLICPIMRSLLTGGFPPMFPTAVGMAAELAVYGLICGLVYRMLPRKPWAVYATLLIAMVAGRIVWGLVTYLILIPGTFSPAAFVAAVFTTGIPGIILQLILVPAVVILLEKKKLMP